MQEIKDISDYKLNLKERIPDVALQLFTERGINSVRMDDVAQTMGISKRTIYELNDQYTGNDKFGLERELDTLFRKITKYPIGNKKNNYSELKSLSCSSSENQNNRYINFINQAVTRPKFPEYYQVNLDKFGKYPFSCGEKIDGFTMKTIKSSKSALNLLTDHEKRIFLSKLNE